MTIFLSFGLFAFPVFGKLILPSSPPRGFNSFDGQRYAKLSWNETAFKHTADIMARDLLPHGYDTIVMDGGWSASTTDEFGRPIPFEARWPSSAGSRGLAPLVEYAHDLGLKVGIWLLRGVGAGVVGQGVPVKGTTYSVDDILMDQDSCPHTWPPPRRWCKCTWDADGIGVNASHPGAQAYYDSLVELYASWGIDFLKWDCLYDNTNVSAGATPEYAEELELIVNAVRKSPHPFVLSLSPGGGMTAKDAARVASEQKASMYRVTGDFHSHDRHRLAQFAFVVGNLSRYIGANSTWPDLDMLDLGSNSKFFGTPAARLHAAMWMMARSPLMFTDSMPTDLDTLNLVTNPLALDIHSHSRNLRVSYQGDCSCVPYRALSESACTPVNSAGSMPCIAVWFADLPNPGCQALAVLNIGIVAGEARIDPADIGAWRTSYDVTNVYNASLQANVTEFKATVSAQGGDLFIIAPNGVAAHACSGSSSMEGADIAVL